MMEIVIMVVGTVMAWSGLIAQAIVLWRDGEKGLAIACAMLWPLAVSVAGQRASHGHRQWVAVLLIGGLVLAVLGFALKSHDQPSNRAKLQPAVNRAAWVASLDSRSSSV